MFEAEKLHELHKKVLKSLNTREVKCTTVQNQTLLSWEKRIEWRLLFYGILRSAEWQFLTDVSGQSVGSHLQGPRDPTSCSDTSRRIEMSAASNSPEEQISSTSRRMFEIMNCVIFIKSKFG